MSWVDRLREAAYTTPGGVRLTFFYEDVKEEFDKKTSGFTFPDANGTFVQDLGHTSRRYPLRVIFWGDDYDIQSNNFMKGLRERGTGTLDHPIYGSIEVVPFGTIVRRDNLKTAANQSIIEIVFWETIGILYPTSQTDPTAAVDLAVAEYNETSSEELAVSSELGSEVEQAKVKASYELLLDNAQLRLQAIADSQANVKAQFDTVIDSINAGIDILVADPLTLAFQTSIALQAPARARTAITARLEAYVDLARSIFSGDDAVVGATGVAMLNDFLIRDLFASGYVSASLVSVTNHQFNTKRDALEAAESIFDLFGELVVWRDDNFEALDEVDTGAAYQKLLEAVALTAGFLVEISFSLKQEIKVTLDRPHTVIDLVAELLGDVDDQIDFFIHSNNLVGNEILEVPMGREIVYYV